MAVFLSAVNRLDEDSKAAGIMCKAELDRNEFRESAPITDT
jgi:hypothetical protein